MSRRQLLTAVGIVLGAMVAVCGLYLTQAPAGDRGTTNAAPDKSASVTISSHQLERLLDRISSLEARVRSLEKERSARSLSIQPAGKVIHPLYVEPAWPNDGFGPVQTIPAG